MTDKKREAILLILAEMARKSKTTLVRVQSNRYKIHCYSDKNGKRVYFRYDRKYSRVAKILTENDAVFASGESAKYKSNKVRILASLSPSDTFDPKNLLTFGYSPDLRVRVDKHRTCFTYLIEVGNRVIQADIRQLRKI